jgi:hypothetical protein
VEEHVIERLTPHKRSLDEDAEVVDNFLLSVEIFEFLWADFALEIRIALDVSDC